MFETYYNTFAVCDVRSSIAFAVESKPFKTMHLFFSFLNGKHRGQL